MTFSLILCEQIMRTETCVLYNKHAVKKALLRGNFFILFLHFLSRRRLENTR